MKAGIFIRNSSARQTTLNGFMQEISTQSSSRRSLVGIATRIRAGGSGIRNTLGTSI